MKRSNIQQLLGTWKLKSRKLAKNRKSQFEQLEARQLLAAAVWTNVLQPLDVSRDTDARISPLDALLVINELNLRVYSPQFQPLPREIPDGSLQPPFVDTSCDGYVSPIDALLVINRLNARDVPAGTTSSSGKPTWDFATAGGSERSQGRYVFDACSPRLIEGDSFSTQLSANVFVPDETTAIKIKFDAPHFDSASQSSIRDALEFLVLDQAGQPLMLPYSPDLDAVFNWSEGLDSLHGPAVQYASGSVTINLAGIATAGSTVQVVARLANNDQDNNSAVTIRGIETVDAHIATPLAFQPPTRTTSHTSFDFASLTDVSSSLQVLYGDTTLSEDDASSISSNIKVLNSGSYPIVGTLLAVLNNLSAPSVALANPDGFTADGLPYLNLTAQMGESLGPSSTSAPRYIQFKNPSRERFSYTFKLLSGLNKLPVASQQSDALIGVGHTFTTKIHAIDPEQQPLVYSLVASPQGMTIDPSTGHIAWTPSSNNIGSSQVRYRVRDSLGGTTEQSFTIDVRAAVANRPPIITSTPETDAVVSSPFEVQTYATGPQPVAVDVLVQSNGTPSFITSNEGDQQLGYLDGTSQGIGPSQPVSIGEPHPSNWNTPFNIAYAIELGLAPNTAGNFQRDIQGVLSAELNSDGNPDLIVLANRSASSNWNDANDRGHVVVQLGNGDGTFRESWTASLPVVAGRIGRAASAHVKDVTGDGRLDLIVTTIATNQTLVYPGNAATIFEATPIISVNPGNYIANTQVADLNADGNLDLVLFESEQVQISGRRGIGIQLGDGTGRFSGTTLIAAVNNNGGYGYVTDVDGINGPDLIRLNYVDSRLEVRLNNGSGTFDDAVYSVTQTYFSSTNTGSRNINPTSAYIDDFDGDGKADALVSSPTGTALLKGQGNGQFGNGTRAGNAIIAVDNFDDPRWPGIANSDGKGIDLNGDGKRDFVFGSTVNAGNIMVGLGDGSGSFALRQYNASFEGDIGQGINRAARTLQYIAIADFNRDGVIDIAAGASQYDRQPGAVGILLGDLPGTLRSPVFVSDYSFTDDYRPNKGRSGESVTGDFNGDGYVDIVTFGGAGFGNALYFAAGNGDGTFAPYQAALGGVLGGTSLTSLDIDRDGILDLAWMDGSRFGQAFGLGNGAFQYLPTVSSAGSGPGGVSQQILQTDDFNRDGYLDLVYRLQTGNIDTNTNTKIVVLIYDPTNRRYRELADANNLITLTPRAFGYYHDEALGMGDLNNDGSKEFFTFSRSIPTSGTPARFTVYEQSASVGGDAFSLFRKTVLENPAFLPADTAIQSYVVEDFDGDGKNDIAYSTHSATTVVMYGNGDFTFRDATTYLTNGFLLNKGDFNGDGLTDLVTTWGYGFISFSQRPFNGVLLGRPDGTFSEQFGYTTATSQTNGLFVGDFNGDGTDDLTGLGGLKHNEAFIGKTKGLADIATGDVNGDGRPDTVTVVAGLDRVKVLHGVIDETFSRQKDLFTGLFPVAVELVDADNDELLDILTANQVGKSLSLFKHTSPTTFARSDIDLPVRPTALVQGDLNGDGKPDAVVVSSHDETLVALLGGDSTFVISLVLPLGFGPSGIAAGDVSGDGKLDLVLSDSIGDRMVVLVGRGDGTFIAPYVVPAMHAPGAVGIADLNADGRSDIVVAQPTDDRIALLFNRGSGRFTSPQLINVGDNPVAIQIRDVNQDNKPDILVPNHDENTLSVILNRFDPSQVWTYKPTAVDPDGDAVAFELTSAPGGMLYDNASNTIYWAPMPEQVGSSGVVLTASDGNGGSTDQGFMVTVTAPISIVPPIFTSTPVTSFGADGIYRYEPNVRTEADGPKRFTLVEGPEGMVINPTTGAVEWDNRSGGIKLFANVADPGAPVSNQNTGQIQIPDSPSLRSASVTAEGWFKFEDPKGALWDQLLSKQLSNTNSATPSWGLEYYYGTLRAHVGKPGQSTSLATITSPSPIEFNKWVHIALTFDDSTKRLTLYVNGKSAGTAISPEAIGYNELPVVSGANYITLSRVKIWNTARSAAQISAQSLSDFPNNTPGLVLDLKFQESQDVSTILDASAAKNHGRLIGTPDFVNFPNREPALASQGNFPVSIRIEDGKGGVTEQSFTISTKAPTATQVSGTVFDDLNGNGLWDRRLGDNLALNGDFASGAIGYTTDFIHRENINSFAWLGDSQSTVANSTAAFPLTSSYSAHSYGAATDFMLLANGDTQERVVWRQSISVVAGQTYDFSFWAIRANSYEAPRLAVRVNGKSLGTTLSLNDVGLNSWKQFFATYSADSSTSTALMEIVLLGSTTAPNPGLNTAENVVGIDDILMVPSSIRRVVVSGKANPYLAGMPDGSTAFGSTAPLASPPPLAVTAGQVLRFAATGHTTADGFIASRSADGIVTGGPGLVVSSDFNGISKFASPRYGSLIGVFLDNSLPSNQTPPVSLDFRATGNVPGGIDYTSLQPALRQVFFIGDGRTADGLEQTITVPPGASRLFLANSSTTWANNTGEFEVQIFDAVSEPVQVGRQVYIDGNFNGRRDASEPSAITDVRGVYALAVPGTTAQLGLQGKAGEIQSLPEIPHHNFDALADVLPLNFGSLDFALTEPPRFTSQPVTTAIAPGTYRYQSFAQSPTGQAMTYALAVGPQGMSIDPTSGVVRWNPLASNQGDNEVILKATDIEGAVTLQRFTIKVDVNSTPSVTSLPPSLAFQAVPFEYQVLAQDAEQSELRYSLTASPVGMTIDATTGLIRWLPSVLGSATAIVEIADQKGGVAIHSFSLTVQAPATNRAPRLTSGPREVAVLNREFASRIVATDEDHDVLTYTLVSGPSGLTVSLIGEVFWTPTLTGSFDFVARVSDNRGATAEHRYTLNVVSRAPASDLKITSRPTTAAVVGQLFEYDVVAKHGELFELLNNPTGMSIAPARGTIRWLPTQDQLGVQTVKVRVSDVLGNTTEQSFTVAVRSSALVPTISSAPPTEGAVGQTLVYAVSVVNPSQSPLTYALTVAPQGMQIDAALGVITWTPNSSQIGSAIVSIRVRDAIGNFSSQTFSVVVAVGALNRPPVSMSMPPLDAVVGQPYAYTMVASDPEGASLSYAVRSAPSGFLIAPTTGVVTWTPSEADIGTVAIVLTATDLQGGVAVQSIQIDVRAANRLPAIRSNPALIVSQGAMYQYDVIATDPDRGPLFYSLVTAPIGMTIDALGRIRWQTQLDTSLGGRNVVVRVVDGLGGAVSQSYTFGVVADTLAPRITIIVSGEPVLYPWTVSPAIVRVMAADDVGLSSVELKVDGQSVELAADGTARVYFSAPGNGRLQAIAKDAAGNQGTAIARVSMRSGEEDGGGNPAPEATITSVTDGTALGGVVNIIGTAAAPDFERYVLSYRRIDQPNYTTILTGTAQITAGSLGRWDTTLLENDNYILKLEVYDTFGSFAAVEVEVSVSSQLKLGNFRLSFEDLNIPVAGIPISIARTYDTLRADRDSDFGFGWRLEYRNADLRTSLPKSGLEDIGIYTPFKPGTKVFLTLPGGKREGFTFTPEIKVLPGFGRGNDLVLASPRFVSDRGVTSTLSAGSGQLIVNPIGELYTSGGIPWNPSNPDVGGYTLTTQTGMGLQIDGGTGKIKSIADKNNNVVSLTDSEIRAGEISAQIYRDGQGRIVKIVDPSGKEVQYGYSPTGDLISVRDREANLTKIAYRTDRAHYLDRVTDPLGRTGLRMEYSSDGRLSQTVDADGNQSSFTFNIDTNTEVLRDAIGGITSQEYDERGNIVRLIDANGGEKRFAFDNENNVIRETNATGTVIIREYDARNNLVAFTDARGNRTAMVYDVAGNLISNVFANGTSTSQAYDQRGNVTRMKDQAGHELVFEYDPRGRLARSVQPNGAATTFEYNERGHLARQALSNGRVTEYTYDANGLVLRETTRSGAIQASTSYSYDNNGRVTKVVDALGGTSSSKYDANGNLVEQIDANGNSTKFTLDKNGQVTAIVYPDTTPSDADNPRRTMSRNALGWVIQVIDENGGVTDTEYDGVGQVIKSTQPTSATGTRNVVSYSYTLDGRIASVTNGNLATTRFEYDAAGNEVAKITPLGSRSTKSYDALNRLVQETNALGNVTRYEYDLLNNQTKVITPDGASVQAKFDSMHNKISALDQAGGEYRYEYDAWGSLITVIDPMGGIQRYEYDLLNRLTATIDPNNNRISIDRDELGRESTVTMPMGQKRKTIYDAVGNVIEQLDFSGAKTTIIYDVRNRPTRLTYADGTETVLAYDHLGNPLRESNSAGTIQKEYDRTGRLVSVTNPDGSIERYQYDAVGNRVGLESIAGYQSFEFDLEGNMTRTIDSQGKVTEYAYDLLGNLTRQVFSNGVVHSRTYDSIGRIGADRYTKSGQTQREFVYQYDTVGNRVEVRDSDGTITRYGYDRLNRAVSERIVAGNTLVFEGKYNFDAASNRTRISTNREGDSVLTYDRNNRLISTTRGTTTETRLYDLNGNLVNKSAADSTVNYRWSKDGRLTGVDADNNGTFEIEYRYDAHGIRIAETVNGNTHNFTLDRSLEEATVLAERNSQGIVKRYSVGTKLDSQADNSGALYYVVDAANNTRAVMDENGTVVSTWTYDTMGASITQTGNADVEFLFAGEQRDDETGFDYLRQRYLDPGVGAFISPDPLAPNLGYPITANSYLYAMANSQSFRDPSGGSSLMNLVVASAIQGTISAGLTLAFTRDVKQAVNSFAFGFTFTFAIGGIFAGAVALSGATVASQAVQRAELVADIAGKFKGLQPALAKQFVSQFNSFVAQTGSRALALEKSLDALNVSVRGARNALLGFRNFIDDVPIAEWKNLINTMESFVGNSGSSKIAGYSVAFIRDLVEFLKVIRPV
ncbi:MAG: FG-GAP-like repeat-containing protein [Pirellulaceae bacterium]|nr:FG-GAP-like repeat-containing protein [Pirellulaceae bacterium]